MNEKHELENKRQELEIIIRDREKEKKVIVRDLSLIENNFIKIEDLIAELEEALNSDRSNLELSVINFIQKYKKGLNLLLDEFNELSRRNRQRYLAGRQQIDFYRNYFGEIIDQNFLSKMKTEDYDFAFDCYKVANSTQKDCYLDFMEIRNSLDRNLTQICNATSYLDRQVELFKKR